MRQTPESLMISAMLNTGDPSIATSAGVRPDHFTDYRDEYEWVNRFYSEYGTTPTAEQLASKFPHFPNYDRELKDPRHSAKEMVRDYSRKMLLKALSKAGSELERDNVEDAYKAIEGLTLESFSPPPENLLACDTFLDDYNEQVEYMPFPWPTLQSKTGGLAPEQFMFWAARPAQGKSWFLANIAAEAAFAGYRVMFYSLEMSKRELQVRSHAILGNKIGWGSQLNTFDMLHRRYSLDDYKLLLRELSEKTQGLLHIQDQTSGKVTPSVIASRASEYDLTIIDYVGLMGPDGGGRITDEWRAAAEISNSLKSVAKSKKTRILAAAQISKTGDADGKPIPPKMKNLAATDAFVQDADLIVTHTRMRGGHAAVCSLEKNRSGVMDVRFHTKFLANQGDFKEITKAEAEDLCDEYDD